MTVETLEQGKGTKGAQEDVTRALAVAREYAERQDGRKAEAVLRQILTTHPDHPEALHELGVIALRSGQPTVAVPLLRSAAAGAPGLWNYHSNLGVACRAAGRQTEALEAYREALRLNPKSPACHYNVANLLRQIGELTEAEGHYRDALRANPAYHQARITLAEVLRDQGRVTDARRELASIPSTAAEAKAAAELLARLKG